MKKSETLPCEAQFRAKELMLLYDGHVLTFTDGSKTKEGVGCAFVSGRDTRSFSLPANSSVFTSELVAISKALSFIEVGDEVRHLILTDSLTLFLSGFFNANSVRGGGRFGPPPPEISKTTLRRDILQTALDRLRRDLQLL